MNISQHCVTALTWTLEDTLGEPLDRQTDPIDFVLGSGDLFAAIEAALQGYSAGDTVYLQLEPEQAFGDFNPQLLFLEPLARFGPDLQAGMLLEGNSLPAGCNPQMPRDLIYTVSEIYPEHVVLDGNHPLAGIALRLTLHVQSVRPASAADLQAAASAYPGFFKINSNPRSVDAH